VLGASDIGRNRRAARGEGRPGEELGRPRLAASLLLETTANPCCSSRGNPRACSKPHLRMGEGSRRSNASWPGRLVALARGESERASASVASSGVADATRMWVKKLTTTDRAQQAGTWLWSRRPLGLRDTSRGGEGGWTHLWESDANRDPTRIDHFGGRASVKRSDERPFGAGLQGGERGSREGAGGVEAMGAH